MIILTIKNDYIDNANNDNLELFFVSKMSKSLFLTKMSKSDEMNFVSQSGERERASLRARKKSKWLDII